MRRKIRENKDTLKTATVFYLVLIVATLVVSYA